MTDAAIQLNPGGPPSLPHPSMPESRAASSLDSPDALDSQQGTTGLRGNEFDVALMRRIATGDEAAFEQLIERHQNAVVGTVAKMLGNASDAEDIAQQVFIRLWKSAPRYKPTAKFTTFLFTIMRNLVFNESRRKSRKKEYSINEREDDYHLQTPDPRTTSPDDNMLHAELQSAVDQAIALLPEKQRLAVILRRYENMPYDEIGRVLKLSIPAVKSQLFRARNTLRQSLQHYLNE